MITITNYVITENLYIGKKSKIYRGYRQSDSVPVVIKVLHTQYPQFQELVMLRNEYNLTKNLNLPGIIKSYSLAPYNNSYAIIMEDLGGISLQEYIRTKVLDLAEFLAIAIKIVQILANLYEERVIHKDIKPANILINPDTKEIKLIDFSIASLLPRETQSLSSINNLEGTLAYISPEQTGRMNRGIDYRTDYYSLGVTFYELLTRQLPFTGDDPIEIVHCHIAKQPPLVNEINPKIPPVIAQIVEKLMAKNPEKRYQSALGLQYDLEKCLEQLQLTEQIPEFPIGTRDVSDRFIIPEKLYGRAEEVEQLLAAYERVASGSETETGWKNREIILVSGYSGIGKSALISEVHKPIVKNRGYFIKGKFDQFNRNIPFSAFVQTLRDLMGQLLSETDQQLAQWKTKILTALGENGQIIIEVIPELEKIIGKQLPVPELSGIEAQNRFNLLFQKFIEIFTAKEHPLVIFLDDLQWADLGSLQLIKLLMSESKVGYLLLIGAYRDNEVSPSHPLILALEEMKKASAIINTINLAPLSLLSLNQWISDLLNADLEIARPLTELILKKTQGNPFFSIQFLKALYEYGLIKFDLDQGYWQCDLAQVKVLALTDNVVEFMAMRLQELPEATQNVLKLAACVGNQFDLATLAIVSKQSEIETATALWKALQEEFIIPKNEVYKFYLGQETLELQSDPEPGEYKFLHDRIQQAAYSLIPELERAIAHYQIGKLLLEQMSPTALEEQIFEVVNQLNYGIELITNQTERDQLAQLNLFAVEKASTATAYQAALGYIEKGLILLGNEAWDRQYETTLKLQQIATELTFLCGEFDQMETWFNSVITHAIIPRDQVEVYIVKIQGLISQNRLIEAINNGVVILTKLGVELIENPTYQDIKQVIQELNILVGDRPIADLFHLNKMTDLDQLAIVKLAAIIMPACYHAGSGLFPILITLQVKLSLQYGNSPTSSLSYAAYSICLINLTDNIPEAMQFTQLASRLANEPDAKKIRAETFLVIGLFLHHRQFALRETLPTFPIAYQNHIELGQLDKAGLSINGFCMNSYWSGQNLAELAPQIFSYYQQLFDLKQTISANYCLVYWETTLFLLGNPDQIELSFDDLSAEEKMVAECLSSHDMSRGFFFYLHRAMLRFLILDIQSARRDVIQARQYLTGVKGFVCEAGLYFYDSLIHLADQSELETKLEQIQANQTKLNHWSEYAPMNYLHKWQLVEAERYRVLGDKLAAIEMYEQAIAGAKNNGYVQEEALANELAAKFYLNWEKEKIATAYMQSAYYCYAQWGAKCKTDDLEKCYPHLLIPIIPSPNNQVNERMGTISELHSIRQTHSSNSFSFIDYDAIIKMSLALSGEIQIEQLLTTLVEIIMANSGADKCALILLKDTQLFIEATGIFGGETTTVLRLIPLESSQELPVSLIKYVYRTQTNVLINQIQNNFVNDPYIQKQKPPSILCTPIIKQGKIIGIIYLENSLIQGVFNSSRLEMINLLTAQAAISLENAQLYGKLEAYSYTLEQKVTERTQELKEKATQLELILQKLYTTQSQMIQTEKMSSLGQLVAGIAHEINNPISFISGNIDHANEYIITLIELIKLYQQLEYQPTLEIAEKLAELDLDFLISDLQKLLNSMKTGSDRVKQIVNSLRNFSRLDESKIKSVDLHTGIESTLLILQHRCQDDSKYQKIKIIKEYGQLPLVKCYASELNQVFMNIINNAIDTLHQADQEFSEWNQEPTIRINTSMNDLQTVVIIKIADNGMGIKPALLTKIFDPFFTTKPVGQGTGLGLSISYSIIVEKHHGKLSCISPPGRGAEFIIEIPLFIDN